MVRSGDQPPAPILVQLQCVHCALRTLSGPGQELNLDGDIYLHKLRTLIRDLPAGFSKWDVVLECMDLCFLQKREERSNIVQSFARLLLMSATSESSTYGPTLFAMAHAILLRYPKVRQDMMAVRMEHTGLIAKSSGASNSLNLGGGNSGVSKGASAVVLFTEDELVEDMAMKALREESVGDSNMDHVNWNYKEDMLGDGSWVLPLQRMHVDTRYRNIAYTLSHKELLPMPLRIADARIDPTEFIMNRLVQCMETVPSCLPKKDKDSAGGAGGSLNGSSSQRRNKAGKKRLNLQNSKRIASGKQQNTIGGKKTNPRSFKK